MKSFLWSVSLAILAASVGFAQSKGGQPRFEVATVKLAPPDAILASMNGGPLPAGAFNQGDRDPGRITWSNIRLKRMLQVAYDRPADRISGPAWLDTDGYNVVATVPTGATAGDFRLMVQSLLAERFKLTVHRETKEISGYVLEVAKNGLKITDSIRESKGDAKRGEAGQMSDALKALVIVDQSGFPAPRPGNPYYPPGAGFEMTIAMNGRHRATVLNHSMPGIAMFLGNILGMPVEDLTGLTGTYAFHLEYVPNPPDATPAAAASDPGPGIFDAVQEQLGLKLVSKKVPVEMLVIDHAEKVPTEN